MLHHIILDPIQRLTLNILLFWAEELPAGGPPLLERDRRAILTSIKDLLSIAEELEQEGVGNIETWRAHLRQDITRYVQRAKELQQRYGAWCRLN